MKIAVAGAGYVGLANAVLLAQHNEVVTFDINSAKVERINSRIYFSNDELIRMYLGNKKLDLRATTDKHTAYEDADIIIVSTPTDYDTERNCFDTSSVEAAIKDILAINPKALIVIKSTVPIGFTEKAKHKYNMGNIVFSPEFLREGNELFDSLHPSRIVVGDRSERGQQLAELFLQGALSKDIPVLLTGSSEAEAIKLFSNAYLAMRVAFFNELDSYCESNALDSRQIIDGVGMDPRIGNHYNNPSFGYGGYCLPKDTMQMLADYETVPNDLIKAIVDSNETRKSYIATRILERQPKVVGVYRLTMKKGADNFRESAVHDVIEQLLTAGVEVVVYEPLFGPEPDRSMKVIKDLREFKEISDLILANRMSDELKEVEEKVYSRDIYNRD